MAQTLREMIEEAITEARILECAMNVFDNEHMLLTAMRLSGAPYSFICKVYEDEEYKLAA